MDLDSLALPSDQWAGGSGDGGGYGQSAAVADCVGGKCYPNSHEKLLVKSEGFLWTWPPPQRGASAQSTINWRHSQGSQSDFRCFWNLEADPSRPKFFKQHKQVTNRGDRSKGSAIHMGREKVNSQLSSAISSALGNSSARRTQEPPGHRGTIPCQGGLRVNPHNELRSATMCFSPSGSESCTVVPMDIAQAAFNLNSHPAIFYIPEADTKIIETASEKTL